MMTVNGDDHAQIRGAFLSGKRFIERAQTVYVEVLHQESDPFRLRVLDIDQIADRLRPVDPGPL